MKKIAFVGVVAAWAAFADNGVTNTFTMTTANTPLTAHDYTESANWSDQALGAPTGGESYPTFTASTTPYFVKLPDDFKTTLITLNKGVFLLGDYLKINSVQSKTVAASGNGDYPFGGIIFGNMKLTKRYSTGSSTYLGALQVAGHFRPGAWDGGADGNQIYAHTGRFILRHDLFADNANPMREGAYHYSQGFIENGGFTIYGPKGAPANDSSWNLTADEVYAECPVRLSRDEVDRPVGAGHGHGKRRVASLHRNHAVRHRVLADVLVPKRQPHMVARQVPRRGWTDDGGQSGPQYGHRIRGQLL